MKAVLLAGGLGTRISEESHLKPKPMIEIGSQPILWHIMKYYSTFGIHEFVILAGYKQNKIKEYFANYFVYNSDVTFDMKNNNMEVHQRNAEDWKVTVLDTGLNTMTADVDIDALLKFHQNHGKTATITTVSLAQQKGVLQKEESGLITSFREKSEDDSAIINGGFMVLNPNIFDYITEGDATIFEQKPMLKLAGDGELMGFEHDGFWQCMDTQREKEKLESLWASGKAPWMRWTE